MPHRQKLKLAAAHGVELTLESYKNSLEQRHSTKKLIPLRNGILKRLIGLARESEKHDYSPTQLVALKRITSALRTAKTPKELDEILRITCFLKLEKEHTLSEKK